MADVTETEDGENVIVATLIRGKTYVFHHVADNHSQGYFSFERNVPTPVSEAIADLLEELTEDVPDRDGELITKDVFRIERDAPARSIAAPKKKTRFRIVREDVEEKPILRAPPRKPVTGTGVRKPGAFAKRA